MSKKMMLLALVVASAAMFAMPAVGSAAELHFDNVTSFTGEAPAGELRASGEPTVTCEKTHIKGGLSAGGTTGTIHLDFTGCHINVLGFTVKCRTTGSALDNTVTTEGVIHLITVATGPKPGVLVTANTTTLECAGTQIIVHGDVIGTITSPECGKSSKELKMSFESTGSSQNDKEYTHKLYDLTSTTANGTSATAGLQSAGVVVKSETEGTLTCT